MDKGYICIFRNTHTYINSQREVHHRFEREIDEIYRRVRMKKKKGRNSVIYYNLKK